MQYRNHTEEVSALMAEREAELRGEPWEQDDDWKPLTPITWSVLFMYVVGSLIIIALTFLTSEPLPY